MPLGAGPAAMCRTPSGHPGGYLEAFASLYTGFATQVRTGRVAGATEASFVPGIREAVRGMAFIEAVVDSSAKDGEWRSILNG